MMEDSSSNISPLLLKNLLTSTLIYADKSFLNLGEKYKLLQLIRYLIVSTFILFLRIVSPLFIHSSHEKEYNYHVSKFSKADNKISAFENNNYKGDSSIARALSQLLSIMKGIPVSSRKYEIVRSLADKLIDDNLQEGYSVLREVNSSVLSSAFSRTLSQLQARAAVLDEDIDQHGGVYGDSIGETKSSYYKLSRFLRAVWYYGEAAWSRLGKSELNRCGKSAEKLSAEVLWLAQKLAKCGSVEQAVEKWASASKLAWLALSAEPRLQSSLLKVSVFLIKQAKEMGGNKEDGEDQKEQKRVTQMKLLMSWLPLLCRASNGTDTPVLSIDEKVELEKILEDLIEGLGGEEQEKVLCLWLHHFTQCPSSDWPNLRDCYARWCTASRRLLLRSPVMNVKYMEVSS